MSIVVRSPPPRSHRWRAVVLSEMPSSGEMLSAARWVFDHPIDPTTAR
jgi:hypothetical protein